MPVVDTAQVDRLGLGHLVGAFQGLAGNAVSQADLHVQRDALQLHRVEIVDQAIGRGRAGDEVLPQRHTHAGPVEVAPAQELSLIHI